jgi:ClpP class serine protease
VNDIAEMFYSHVESNRPDSSREDMQGQVFKGDRAFSKGLIDQVVRDKEQVLELLN